jgi:3-oxoacyl-[acyl-carrier protein] reductase
MGLLDGKVAIVTGAGHGIGRGHALELAKEGATVLVNDLGASLAGEGQGRDADLTVDLIEKRGGVAASNYEDVADMEGAARMVAQAIELFGRLDILVNNAGLAQAPEPFTATTGEAFDLLFAVNARAIFLAAQQAVPIMRAQGGGVILNTVSVAAIRPRPNLLAYNSSKGAALLMSKSMAIELAPDRIRVNAVCPGPGDTPMLATFVGGDSAAHQSGFLSTIPLGRLCTPDDIANTMVFLASDEASFITGDVIEVDGGRCI